jgi:hypothetical protein
LFEEVAEEAAAHRRETGLLVVPPARYRVSLPSSSQPRSRSERIHQPTTPGSCRGLNMDKAVA